MRRVEIKWVLAVYMNESHKWSRLDITCSNRPVLKGTVNTDISQSRLNYLHVQPYFNVG